MKRKESRAEHWLSVDKTLSTLFPHSWGAVVRTDDFRQLKLIARDDGTVLSVLSTYGTDGTPIVAFGVGLDATQALMALDATVQGGHWKTDKPWTRS